MRIRKAKAAPKKLTLTELAAEIAPYLKKFECNPKVNVAGESRIRPYYGATTWSTGQRIAVVYVSFQGSSKLTREEAEIFLTWLRAGNVGKHYESLGHLRERRARERREKGFR